MYFVVEEDPNFTIEGEGEEENWIVTAIRVTTTVNGCKGVALGYFPENSLDHEVVAAVKRNMIADLKQQLRESAFQRV